MAKELEFWQQAERSLITKYRKTIWTPFMTAIRQYALIEPGDRIAVCISGGKDSMLLAVLLRMLSRFTTVPFELVYLSMDPGYSPANREKLEHNAALLNVPLQRFESDIFAVTELTEKNPCYLCARMRRGALIRVCKARGLNKLALGHHRDDAEETLLLSLLYEGRLHTFHPKTFLSRSGITQIRPMVYVPEKHILHIVKKLSLPVVASPCR